ncbi:YeiH family protein [Paenibacillus sp. ACRRY]|uniref:YeiH family protein n=1 Tax=Paenibacillus sp. ACRRY TaxID=2918208 RepID=UPI001EF3EA33|nr:YeiH family protein [Paenibacillus sp. ACRRY]MCG7381564.1 YeiH family protein [Paenibacillus sp. ACRRY]
MNPTSVMQQEKKNKQGFVLGIGLTLMLALAAKYAANFPFLHIMGQLVLAILFGMIWRAVRKVPDHMVSGISFSAKKLLRYGIILLGMRLNLKDILHAGPKVVLISFLNITITIFVVYGIAKFFNVEKRLGLLTACGTAICGAAAVVAIAPQIKAKDEETAIGAATVAILGTIFTMVYTLLYPFLQLSASGYGVFSGATLHEIAHVIAAAEPVGQDAVDLAVIVKLTRVAMLVPVAILIGFWTNRLDRSKNSGNSKLNKRSLKSLPIPWFIFGFLMMSALNTLQVIPSGLTNLIILAAYMLIAMAMAGLGLSVDTVTFRQLGLKAFAASFIGSIVLSLIGYVFLKLLNLG